MYKLNRIEDTDIFFLATENVELLGENLIVGSFEEVKSFAETLKEEAQFVGEGDYSVSNQELMNISTERWYLLQLPDRFQIVKTNNDTLYSLPTNGISAKYGSLDNIFTTIESIVNN